jgi:hypothetical protein
MKNSKNAPKTQKSEKSGNATGTMKKDMTPKTKSTKK